MKQGRNEEQTRQRQSPNPRRKIFGMGPEADGGKRHRGYNAEGAFRVGANPIIGLQSLVRLLLGGLNVSANPNN
jgi:hypothetical protein